MPTLTQFIYHLIYDKPYRNVFYYRVGRIHFLFSVASEMLLYENQSEYEYRP